MGVRIGDFKVVYESVTMTAIEPCYIRPSEESLEGYLREHPFPDDPAYSKEDLLQDLDSTGFWTLPKEIKPETQDWITDMLNELI